jgi:uncharacterized membrane protein
MMTSENLKKLTEQELMEEEKKQKDGVITLRVITGLLMVVAIYNATHKGSLMISCLPLFILTFFLQAEENYKALQSEIQSRKSL